MEWTKEKLEDLYWEQNKSLPQIAELFGSTSMRIKYVMEKLGIPRRTFSQALLNKIVYGVEEPTIGDILQRGIGKICQ